MAHETNIKTIPDATYRLQFNSRFTFAQATKLAPYLSRLGISHCYASPYLKARPGSTHGYDIVDHNALNPEIGSEADYERFVAELRRHRMGLIADIVPNHMGIMGSDNSWWLDVLENGPASGYAGFFDIDWHPVKKPLQNKLLIPVLGDHYGNMLEQRGLTLKFDAGTGEFSIYYHQHRFPIDPQTYPLILNAQHSQLLDRFDASDPLLLEYQTLDSSFGKLPERTTATPAQREDRNRDKEVFKRQLARLCSDNASIKQFIDSCVAKINDSADKLHILLEHQAYRLAYWRVAGDEINYRRFFDINELAGLRVEQKQVFEASHRFILSLIEQNKIQGLRLDHADGLYDPVGYNQRLCERIAAISHGHADDMAPPIYIVAEKIVANYEYLTHDWPIHGTTGYEFANIVNGVFVDAGAEDAFTVIYNRFSGQETDFEELVYQAKKQVMTTSMAAEWNVLANRLSQIAESHSKTRDYTLNALRDALLEVSACFPVYRTYINSPEVQKEDVQYIEWAIAQARRRSHAADKSVFDFIHQVLLIRPHSPDAEGDLIGFVKKFQQYTAPVMAKGHEDTALYQYNRLITLNEVGGDPRRFGYSVNAFHFFNQERVKKWPHAMLNLSTHDSKHGADVRARINVLTEIPEQWQQAVFHWHRLNHLRMTGSTVISRNDEYLFYQILLGTWPLTALDDATLDAYRERIRAYMIKAVREAKQYSSWFNPDQEYEQAVIDFINHCLDRKANHVFLSDFAAFETQLRRAGLHNALAQTLLELTSPGVPDIYQGNETWQFSLVDPDNRRPVDFNRIRQLLTTIDEAIASDRWQLLQSLMNTPEDGRIKLFLTAQTLRLRRDMAALFENGEYLKLTVSGPRLDNLVAFARCDPDHYAVIVVPRLMKHLLDEGFTWFCTRLELPADAPRHYRNIFTGDKLSAITVDDHLELNIRELFGAFPVALLVSSADSAALKTLGN
jgi:(1->4)-alpha-D-glucan 1-alpha-D-glucosylmutase